jgi:hypothetical protein
MKLHSRQRQIATQLLFRYSLALLLLYFHWIPQFLAFEFITFLSVSFGYQIGALYVEAYLQGKTWVRILVIEKHELKNKLLIEKDVELEILEFATVGAGQLKSFVHATLVGLGALYSFYNPSDIHLDHVFGKSTFGHFLSIHSLAYFVGDIMDMLRYVKPFGVADYIFIVHHAIAIIGFGIPMITRLAEYFATSVLLYEISTPLLAIRWYLIQTRKGDTIWFKINEFLFIILFTCIRMIWGLFYLSYQTMAELIPISRGIVDSTKYPFYIPQQKDIASALASLVFVLVFISNGINLIFFYKIIGLLFRRKNNKK